MSYGAPEPYDLALLGGFDTICNDPRKSSNYICAITPKKTSQFEIFSKFFYKV